MTSTDTQVEPIWMDCEGSGAESWYCQMCSYPTPDGLVVPQHRRLDILAMIERGDFD